MMKLRIYTVFALTLAMSAPSFSFAQSTEASTATDSPATAYVRSKANEVIQIVNGVSERDARLEQLKAKTREVLDFPMLAERTLGRHWDARSETEKAEFIELMRELIETSYSTELGGEQLETDSYRVQFLGERERRGNYSVDSIVEVKGDAKYVTIRLVRGEGGAWRIYDVVTDDVSLVESYAESFDEIITEHGWSELTDRIQTRIDELKQQEAQR